MMLARLLSKIYKKNGIILIDSQGQKYICGKPDLENPLTIKILKKDLNWKLPLNPDLNFPEAYMRGEILIENGSLLDFLNMFFENIGPKEINAYGYIIKKSFMPGDFLRIIICQENLKRMLSIIMILVKNFMIYF